MDNLDILLLTFVVVGLFATLIGRTFLIFSDTVDKANKKGIDPNVKPRPRTPWLSDRQQEDNWLLLRDFCKLSKTFRADFIPHKIIKNAAFRFKTSKKRLFYA